MANYRLNYLVLTASMALAGIGFYIARNDEQISGQQFVEPRVLEEDVKKDNVIELNEKNLHEKFDFYENWVLRFYQPSCLYCRNVKSAFDSAANKYSPEIHFGQIRFEDNPKLTDLFKINEHPCMIFLKRGKEIERLSGEKLASLSEDDLEGILKKNYDMN